MYVRQELVLVQFWTDSGVHEMIHDVRDWDMDIDDHGEKRGNVKVAPTITCF